VSLAAIGYHFGSKDALMNQAVYESIGDWADELARALTVEGTPESGPLGRFESILGKTFESFSGQTMGSGRHSLS
jgi:AcrR family transcriptional regulator